MADRLRVELMRVQLISRCPKIKALFDVSELNGCPWGSMSEGADQYALSVCGSLTLRT